MSDRVVKALRELRAFDKRHAELGKYFVSKIQRDVYLMDLFVGAALNRSIALTHGFCTLIEARNFLAAAPLLRLQLDTGLRLSAAWLAPDPHSFAEDVVSREKHIGTLVDKSGKKMSDRYLVKQLSVEYPWVQSVYNLTSGYIHFSVQHILSAIKHDDDNIAFTINIAEQNSYAPEDVYVELIHNFKVVSEITFRYVNDWCSNRSSSESDKPALRD